MLIQFDNTYSKLPENFYKRVKPTSVNDPKLICFNHSLARFLGFCDDDCEENKREITEIFSGHQIPDTADPIALAYAGHQFGYFVPQLGDGRAILLGEVVDRDNHRYDIQLKGSGLTPYSRNGDGRAALGPMMREYLVSEAMHALGIKTTRSLALVGTGEYVWRREGMLPGAILTRVARSHIRFGTFEYFAARSEIESLKILADYVIDRHYPHMKNHPNRYVALFECVQNAQIDLMIEWMRVGFIHGVMNTDNMSISGETLDYGPCAFLDEYNPNKVFSSIDEEGRYRFSNQANICHWNLVQLARVLSLMVGKEYFEESMELFKPLISSFQNRYEEKYLLMMCKKIGISSVDHGDKSIIEELLKIMYEEQEDYTLTFRYLSNSIARNSFDDRQIFKSSNKIKNWMPKWRDRLKKENVSLEEIGSRMLKTNPAVIPRNHKIEECIRYAMENNDFSKMNSMLEVLSDPYSPGNELYQLDYMMAPKSNERVLQTFCGT